MKSYQLSIERVYDPFALNQALCRYSRDIFGEKRLYARILHFSEKYKIQDYDTNELINFEDYGLKVDSCNPYIHRRISCLFYWFAVFKPFRVNIKAAMPESENIYIYLEYHNELITYLMAMMVLDCLNWRINTHENWTSPG
jgi:hypothetical protein